MLRRALVHSQANSALLEHDLEPLLREGDYEPGFAMALACKDMRLAVDLAGSVGIPAELAAVVEQLSRELARSMATTPAR